MRGSLDQRSSTLERFDETLDRVSRSPERGRPFVTLTFAQSLDGSITDARGSSRRLSNNRSVMVTHGLRARHDAILVGINTVLVDDPHLTVRLVDGPDPRPIVLDSRLRCPVSRRVLEDRSRRVLIATTRGASTNRMERLQAAGAEVVSMGRTAGGLVDLQDLMRFLQEAGVRSLMVEGGARVITSFLRAHLADHLIVTIAPVLLAGVPTVTTARRFGTGPMPALSDPVYETLGDDLVLGADVVPA